MNLDDYENLTFENPRESDIEVCVTSFAEQHGWFQCKFVSPGLKGVPDRMFIRNGRVLFIELKRRGEQPNSQQKKRHKELREHGAEVHWIDNLQQAYTLLR